MRTLIATLITLMLFATTPVVAGDLEDAAAAYKARDYQKAFRLLKPHAEQGLATAQTMLGLMYGDGNGVPQDHAKAFHWFTKAAKQGQATAQTMLGGMYAQGKGIPEDHARAYAWLSIAAAQGNAGGKKF
jgi:hypothetical protein